jgi:hypothetical protein
MTSHTKTYIEPSDILALRLVCKKCDSTVALSLVRDLNFSRLHSCPNCNEPWLTISGSNSLEPQMKECAESIRKTVMALSQWDKILHSNGAVGFSITFEISEGEGHASRAKD